MGRFEACQGDRSARHSRSMRITCGFCVMKPSASARSSAARIAVSLVAWVISTTATGAAAAESLAGRPLLHDRFQRDVLFAHAGGDCRHRAGPVLDGEADVIAALVGAARNALGLFEEERRGARTPGVTMPRAISAMSAATAEARRLAPAPGPISVNSPTASPSIVTALTDAHYLGDRRGLATMVGCTRCSIPRAVRSATRAA